MKVYNENVFAWDILVRYTTEMCFYGVILLDTQRMWFHYLSNILIVGRPIMTIVGPLEWLPALIAERLPADMNGPFYHLVVVDFYYSFPKVTLARYIKWFCIPETYYEMNCASFS